MKNVIIAFLVVVAAVCIFFAVHGRHVQHKRRVTVFHLKDGRYCYKEHFHKQQPGAEHEGSDWVIWYWLETNGDPVSFYTSNTPDKNENFTPPKGTSWASGASDINLKSPQENDLIDPLDAEPEDVVVDQYGHPEVDADGNLVDPQEIAEATESESSPADSDSSSSSSSDSGSGSSADGGSSGDGGGGGGGDGGD